MCSERDCGLFTLPAGLHRGVLIALPVLAEVDTMLQRIGPRREEPRELYVRERPSELEVAEA
jgi:hypothetical protein